MDDGAVLRSLAPAADRLLARHLERAREWMPHRVVSWQPGSEPVDVEPGVASALVVNLLTEDNLPFYLAGLHVQLGAEDPWWTWVRRWTAEEMRHAIVIRQYVVASQAVDLDALERDRMVHVSSSAVPSAPSVLDALAYLTLQELSTRIAHRNTGQHLDERGRAVMATVAGDENLHHLFYRDLVSAAIELDASATVQAIDRQVRHFTMPGAGIPGFAAHVRAIADAGVFSAAILHADVMQPLVSTHWRVVELRGLDADGARARDRLLAFLDRLERVAARL